MRNRYLIGAGVALAMALSWADARAQLFPLPTGPGTIYFGVEGGYTNLEDATGRVVGTNVGVRQRWDDGYNVGARAGYEWGPWRLEEEFRFQQNGINSLSVGGVTLRRGTPPGDVRGDRNAYAFMTNLIYDFSWFTLPWAITPHLGAGIGAVELRDGMRNSVVGNISHDTQWEFGYQAIAGIRYNINPALAFDLDYRFLGTTDPTFRSNSGVRYTSEYHTHNLVASLSMRFGAPPPPVVAPPAPPAPPPLARRVFLVFFDWDRDTITPDGMRIVQQAAEASRTAQVQIQVTGYTDASGSAGYNQRLSERRANNVANALVRFGVPRQAMVVSGRGKNDQRVPTADGVREPQNRRVEIVFP
jgi:outer membrane protein OmpA-like peptidoglycan-associated protein